MLKDVFQIGAIRIEPDRNVLIRDGRLFKIEPRIMDVLCLLASDPGAVFSRDTLIETIWNVEYGADESLTRAISILRKTARQAGEPGDFIETIPRKGYRLAAPVLPIAPDQADPAAASTSVMPDDIAQMPSPTSTDTVHGHRLPGRHTVMLGLFGTILFLALAIFFVLNGASGPDTLQADDTEPAPSYSIAVLPFEPFSESPQDGRFADGITEDLINALSQIDALLVAARSSSSSYKGQDEDVRDIGGALGVSFIVDGTVRRSDDTVRVTTQLIRAADGFVVWSDTMEEPVADTFALQDQIVREIGLALELRLGVGSGLGLSPGTEVDPAAVEFYYEGLQQYENRFLENGSVQDAREALRAAVDLEPDFAKAWSALVKIGISWSSGPLARDKETFVATLKEDIDRALALNPEDPSLHAALVFWHAKTTLDLRQAKYHLEKAETLAPDAVDTLGAGSVYNWVVGKGEKSLELTRRAQRRDPLNDVMRLSVAWRQAVLGDFDTAFEFFDACQQSNCLQEGFIAYAAAAAIYSGNQERMEHWSTIYDEFEAYTKNVPPSLLPRVVEINGAFYSTGFGQPDATAEQARVRAVFEEELITDHIGMWAPTFADFLPEDTFFEVLESAHDRGDLFSSPYGMSWLYGINSFPDWVLEHPRYHRLWERPDLAELAKARRGYGQTSGLPR